mgnify:CR=1 FL=1
MARIEPKPTEDPAQYGCDICEENYATRWVWSWSCKEWLASCGCVDNWEYHIGRDFGWIYDWEEHCTECGAPLDYVSTRPLIATSSRPVFRAVMGCGSYMEFGVDGQLSERDLSELGLDGVTSVTDEMDHTSRECTRRRMDFPRTIHQLRSALQSLVAGEEGAVDNARIVLKETP